MHKRPKYEFQKDGKDFGPIQIDCTINPIGSRNSQLWKAFCTDRDANVNVLLVPTLPATIVLIVVCYPLVTAKYVNKRDKAGRFCPFFGMFGAFLSVFKFSRDGTRDSPFVIKDFPFRTRDFVSRTSDFPGITKDFPVTTSHSPARTKDFGDMTRDFSGGTKDFHPASRELSSATRLISMATGEFGGGSRRQAKAHQALEPAPFLHLAWIMPPFR